MGILLSKRGSGKHNSCLAAADTKAERGHRHWGGSYENHQQGCVMGFTGRGKIKRSLKEKGAGRSTG